MKLVAIIGAVVIAVLLLIGDGFAVYLWLTTRGHAHIDVAKTVKADQTDTTGPLSFATIPKFVVSLPATADTPGDSYIQLGFAFATHDPKAVDAFDKYQPIIKADLILDLMQRSGDFSSGSSTAKRQNVIKGTLDIVNAVIHQEEPALGTAAFQGAYLTDFVAQ
jgi:flagellar basal body-associated protein FliL